MPQIVTHVESPQRYTNVIMAYQMSVKLLRMILRHISLKRNIIKLISFICPYVMLSSSTHLQHIIMYAKK